MHLLSYHVLWKMKCYVVSAFVCKLHNGHLDISATGILGFLPPLITRQPQVSLASSLQWVPVSHRHPWLPAFNGYLSATGILGFLPPMITCQPQESMASSLQWLPVSQRHPWIPAFNGYLSVTGILGFQPSMVNCQPQAY